MTMHQRNDGTKRVENEREKRLGSFFLFLFFFVFLIRLPGPGMISITNGFYYVISRLILLSARWCYASGFESVLAALRSWETPSVY